MIRSLARLFRLRLALLNGVAAAGGVLLFPASVGTAVLLSVICGVTLLAAGGSALNQVLERDFDRLMERTRLRPVACGELQPKTASLIGCLAVLAGSLIIAAVGGVIPAAVGIAGIVCYLAVYTPMKRRTPCALAVGAVSGALPPLIGWCSAGGNCSDFRILLLAGLLYLWQIPHFWLFQRRHAADYRAAGFPLLSAATRETGFPGLFGLWIVALITATMLLPAFGLVSQGHAAWYALFPLPLIVLALLRSEQALFSYLNLFPLLVTLMIIGQKSPFM